MKRIILIGIFVLSGCFRLMADEGMWLLPYLQKVNYEDMKAKGLKLKATDIYNPDGNSLKDAIVIFGSGCTGEIVSPEGLLFTNHHCGHGNIQSLSSVEHDYLANGFWAMNKSEELPVPGLTVKFVRSIEDVTGIVLTGITDEMTEDERNAMAEENRKVLAEELTEKHPGKVIEVAPYFGGNQYFATILEEYTDIRFVGAPPTSIGKFGGDTDNWMWPRHTGDFSIFRVYSAPDGSPADYSSGNVPYKAPVHLKISAKGYKEGDFTMIMGFPGRTTRYMSTYEIDEMLDVANPNRIYIRGERQDILMNDMKASDKVRIQYAAKYAQSSNYWKNSIGKSKAIRQLKIRDTRKAQENGFAAWAAADPSREKYTRALPLMAESKEAMVAITGANQTLIETVLNSIEVAYTSVVAYNALKNNIMDDPEKMAEFSEDLYKDYNEETDKKVAKRMLEILIEKMPLEYMPDFVDTEINGKFGGDINAYVDWVYATSVFSNKEKFDAFAAQYNPEAAAADPARRLYRSVVATYINLSQQIAEPTKRFYEGHRLYIAGLMEMSPDARHYPDANSTIRLTYGTVEPYSPADAVEYDYLTTLRGVMEKEDETNPVEFTVPNKLKELYYAQDYGPYADKSRLTRKQVRKGEKGTLNTCFLSTNDITGGNSGSPILNAHGELIGLAFDGNWEAMSGDVVFEPQLQRCINVDARYVLFVIDKFAGASHLLDEMTIVW